MAKRLIDFSNFFSLSKASALVVTDAKLDDTFFLWTFFLMNFRRPVEQEVELRVFITGVKDSGAAICVVKHLFEKAKEYSTNLDSASVCKNVSLRVFASRRPGAQAARHELDTYAPYNDGSDGFPQAEHEIKNLEFWQDLDVKTSKADFVAVIAQFFAFEVIDSSSGAMREGILDYLFPKPGGVLAFQAGFNTKVPGDSAQIIWKSLETKIGQEGGHIVFISNAFSFDKSTGKPGTIDANGSFVGLLKCQSSKIWDHLITAGLRENLLFASDQMAKWLTFMRMDGVDYEKGELGESIKKLITENNLPETKERQAMSIHLKEKFVKEVDDAGGSSSRDVNSVIRLCDTLHRLVQEILGPQIADYLGRAIANMEKFGKTLEATDGQHLTVLLQAEEPVLHPCVLNHDCWPEFPETQPDKSVLWAARSVDVPRSLKWMDRSLGSFEGVKVLDVVGC
eukprot:TRINITY_DN8571_c3_g1_i1.p1 TRINITY_DN8571_c3_g1~~TRINITY_DN8571_c3_g1_i1.p1  ORF type:complete len:453 (-),score=90.35 TRINITY_DN8571_c3_g1_i1:220-1578(-)